MSKYEDLPEDTQRALDKALGAVPHSMAAHDLMARKMPQRLRRLSDRALIARLMDHAGDGLAMIGSQNELDRCLAALADRHSLTMEIVVNFKRCRGEIAAHIW